MSEASEVATAKHRKKTETYRFEDLKRVHDHARERNRDERELLAEAVRLATLVPRSNQFE